MTTVPTTSTRNPADWLLDGTYLVPIVDNLTPYWVRIVRTGLTTTIDASTDLTGWTTATDSAAADALDRVASAAEWARANYGQQTGICGACAGGLDDATRDRGGVHADCGEDRKALNDATRAEKSRVRAEALAAVIAAWADAGRDRRARALANAGPVTIAKLDDASVRVATGLSAGGGLAPMHEIRDRTDPRIPSWVARVVVQLSALNPDRFNAVWHWVDLSTMRHMAVDLASEGPAVRRIASCTDMTEAGAALRLFACEGDVLHASLSCQPEPYLFVTLRAGSDDQ